MHGEDSCARRGPGRRHGGDAGARAGCGSDARRGETRRRHQHQRRSGPGTDVGPRGTVGAGRQNLGPVRAARSAAGARPRGCAGQLGAGRQVRSRTTPVGGIHQGHRDRSGRTGRLRSVPGPAHRQGLGWPHLHRRRRDHRGRRACRPVAHAGCGTGSDLQRHPRHHRAPPLGRDHRRLRHGRPDRLHPGRFRHLCHDLRTR